MSSLVEQDKGRTAVQDDGIATSKLETT